LERAELLSGARNFKKSCFRRSAHEVRSVATQAAITIWRGAEVLYLKNVRRLTLRIGLWEKHFAQWLSRLRITNGCGHEAVKDLNERRVLAEAMTEAQARQAESRNQLPWPARKSRSRSPAWVPATS
jgi:hypothetical protein